MKFPSELELNLNERNSNINGISNSFNPLNLYPNIRAQTEDILFPSQTEIYLNVIHKKLYIILCNWFIVFKSMEKYK